MRYANDIVHNICMHTRKYVYVVIYVVMFDLLSRNVYTDMRCRMILASCLGRWVTRLSASLNLNCKGTLDSGVP